MKLAIGPFEALRRYVSREFWTTFRTLATDYGWQLLEADRQHSGPRPEVVLFWESYPRVAATAAALRADGTRVYVMTDDLHHKSWAMHFALHAADGILSTYAPCLGDHYPDVDRSRVSWVPHAANPDFLMPLAGDPSRTVFVSGAMSEHYPLRRAMRALALRRPEVARLFEHPGYGCTFDYNRDPRVGRGYAASMRECLAGFTDALQYRYLVAKHFEIPATGALLIADRAAAPQLAELGFADGVHYVSASEEDLEEVVDRVLDPGNAAEIESIRRRGHALVHERHTTDVRARQIDEVCV